MPALQALAKNPGAASWGGSTHPAVLPGTQFPRERGAGPWHLLPLARRAHLATLRLSWGCSLAAISGSTWLRRRWSSALSSCSSSTFLSLAGLGAVLGFS